MSSSAAPREDARAGPGHALDASHLVASPLAGRGYADSRSDDAGWCVAGGCTRLEYLSAFHGRWPRGRADRVWHSGSALGHRELALQKRWARSIDCDPLQSIL